MSVTANELVKVMTADVDGVLAEFVLEMVRDLDSVAVSWRVVV